MTRLLARCLVCLAALGACEAPPVRPTQDDLQQESNGRIEGSIVFSGAARGNVVALLYSAERPPPPAGTGRPVAFTLVPEQTLFGSAIASSSAPGPFVADYVFSQVRPGRYLIRAFLDRDACSGPAGTCRGDFIPWYGVTAEPNGGDVGGAAVNPSNGAPYVIELLAGASEGVVVPALGVTVSLSEALTTLPDRPAFGVSPSSLRLVPSEGPKVVELVALPIDTGLIHQRAPAFLAQYIDDDKNGVPDDANGDSVPDFWPKVIVRKLSAQSPLLDENDLDRDGVLDASGADYNHVNPGTGGVVSADGRPDLVVLAAAIDPADVQAALTGPGGEPKLTPTPLSRLRLIVRPTALDLSDPKAPAPLSSVPSGQYAIILVQVTGQTWRVPNELSPGVADSLGLPAVASQAFVIQVP